MSDNNRSSRFSAHFNIRRVTASVLSAVCLVFSAGCAGEKTESAAEYSVIIIRESTPEAVSSSSAHTSSAPVSAVGSSASAPLSSVVSSSASSSSKEETEPHFSFSEEDKEKPPASASVQIRSLSQALGDFSEIASKKAEGTPEEVVKTLLERNVLCFAAMQGKGWTSGGGSGIVPITSDYFKSADQMINLFASTYTENQTWRLMHPQEAGGYGEVFRDGEDGELCFDMSHLRRYHGDSFADPTYAAVISASDSEIVFGRYYSSTPSASAAQPNNMNFRIVREYGEWVLENYITDAESWYQPAEFIKTGRVGAPELMELAKEQVGNIGGEKYWSWYGFGAHIEWCAAFISWIYAQAGKSEPFFTGVYSGVDWFRARDQWGDASFKDIAPGDCIFFDWNDDGDGDHVGLVAGTDGSYVYTIEGNRDDVCIQRAYSLDYQYILGYGLMEWDR